MSGTDFEREMAAISTVYALREGKTLTLRDYEAIQQFCLISRRDGERVENAFHRGYEQGLSERSAAQSALCRAAAQFEFYEREHRKKGTPDGDAKAVTNAEMARFCRQHSGETALASAPLDAVV